MDADKNMHTYDTSSMNATYGHGTNSNFYGQSQAHQQYHENPGRTYNHSTLYKQYQDFRINSEYLRKNVKVSCSDDSNLLEFYMKLRISIQKGGIFLTNLENIKIDKPIYDIQQHMTSSDYEAQSHALFAILSNEDVIPTDYVHATNCITAMNETMNGFGALKNMLMTVHPSLTRTLPPKIPPTLSTHSDLHTYDQALRNFYLKNYLYTGFQHSDIEKSEQYVKSLDTSQYQNAKQRIITQIDNVKLYGGDMPHQFKLENISGTVLNMSEYQTNGTSTAQVNMLQRTYNNQSRDNPQRQPKPTTNRRTPYTKVQCGACKTFGHKAAECHLAGKVLAINQLQAKSPELCKQILASHIVKNKPDRRLAIIKQLQQAQFIDDSTEAEDYLLDEDMNNTIDVTLNAAAATITLEDANNISE